MIKNNGMTHMSRTTTQVEVLYDGDSTPVVTNAMLSGSLPLAYEDSYYGLNLSR